MCSSECSFLLVISLPPLRPSKASGILRKRPDEDATMYGVICFVTVPLTPIELSSLLNLKPLIRMSTTARSKKPAAFGEGWSSPYSFCFKNATSAIFCQFARASRCYFCFPFALPYIYIVFVSWCLLAMFTRTRSDFSLDRTLQPQPAIDAESRHDAPRN